MEFNLNVNSVLFSAGKKVSVLGDIKTGSKCRDEEAKCSSHTGRAEATLSNAVFTVKAFALHEVAIARSTVTGQIYGELRHKSQDGTIAQYEFLCNDSIINYANSCPEDGDPYSLVPIVCEKVFGDSSDLEIHDTFYNAVRAVETKDPKAPIYCYKFCDAFYYNYAKRDPVVKEVVKGYAISAVKKAFKLGTMQEIANESWMMHCEAAENATAPKEETKKVTKKPRWESVLKDIKAGKYLIQYEWSDEQLRHVPPMSYLDTFIPSEEFYEILRKISFRLGDHMVNAITFEKTEPDDIKNDIVNILLYGDPGSGKTAMVHAIAAATGMPLYSIKFNEDSEDDVFEGKNKIVEGKISFVETEFLKGFEKGGIVLMEEINLGRANMLTSVMNQAMEYPFYVEKNGYEKVVRHPLVAAFATMNLDTDGTTALNSAMAQRFNNKYMVDEPSEKQFKDRLVALGFPKERVDYVYGVYGKIRSYLKETEARSKYLKELSIRQCIAALQDMEEGTEASRAVYNTMFGAICIKNRKLAETIRDGILATYPDYTGE